MPCPCIACVHERRAARGLGRLGGWLVQRARSAEPSTPALAAHLAADGVELREGQRAEVCLGRSPLAGHGRSTPRAGWRDRGHRLRPRRGRALRTPTHGRHAADLSRPRGRRRPLRRGRPHATSPRTSTSPRSSAQPRPPDWSSSARPRRATSWRGWAWARCWPSWADALARSPQAYLEARASVARLLDPRQLGGFRVLAWARPADDGSVGDAARLQR